MIHNLLILLRNKKGLLILINLFIFFILYDLPWDNVLNNTLLNIQYKIRGTRQLSNKIVLIHINAEDIQSLKGWPITRDYYGYATYVLNQLGVKVVGFDMLFDTEDKRYPEYDETLIDFMDKFKNVCLPMVFSEIEYNQTNKIDSSGFILLNGKHPVSPINKFSGNAAGIGFSNISDEVVINKVPLVISYKDTFIYSFGFELARLYLQMHNIILEANPPAIHMMNLKKHQSVLPIDQKGNIYLNHFGGPENISAINFLDLLHTFNENRDSIKLNEKLAIVAVTAPGYSSLKTTPLAAAIPSVFIHLTVAENIIERNYLRILPDVYQLLCMFLLILSLLFILRMSKIYTKMITVIMMIVSYYIIVMFLFSYLNIMLPAFYPGMAFISIFLYTGIIEKVQIQREQNLQKKRLQSQIEEKQQLLNITGKKLEKINKDFNDELKRKEILSQDYHLLIKENKNRVLELEKQIRDLQSFVVVDKKNITLEIPEFIYAENSMMVQVLELIHKVSTDDIAVLIKGETGTGKELSAKAIHKLSMRKNKPFVAVNCGALSETLLESELFGHEKGSFTGAYVQHRGRFEVANGGTIFLDEITETSLSFQAKLLRTLQEKTIERIGSEKEIKIDVRIISASSKYIEDEIQSGRFREDLFYRLNGFPIVLPTLRERKEDIPLLTMHFLEKHGYKSVGKYSDQAMEYLIKYNWPGNIRELENIVRRCAILARSEKRDMIQTHDLPEEIVQQSSADITYQSIDQQILELLRSFKFIHSAISQTAKVLGNRDRGTITEYFKGICFEYLCSNQFDIDLTVKMITNTGDMEIQNRVKDKIIEYLKNLNITSGAMNILGQKEITKYSQFKGLPKKYHQYLFEIIEYFVKEINVYHKIINK